MLRIALILTGLLVATSVMADSPKEASNPCSRGSASMTIGGVNLDELRCAVSAAVDEAKHQATMPTERLISLQATVRMQESDLEAARKAKSDNDAYWKAWCGDRPGCFTPPQ